MNPGEHNNLESANSQNATARYTNRQSALPIDLPPSYSEAMRTAPYYNANYEYRPSAPPLESNNTHFNTTDVQNDRRFQKWDDKATRIFITKRLELNDKFNNAQSSWDKDLLWNFILTDLLSNGYHLNIFQLKEYWDFLYSRYTSISNSLSSADGGSHWPYYEQMHTYFKNQNSSHTDDTMTSLTTNAAIPNVIPVPIPVPTAFAPVSSNQNQISNLQSDISAKPNASDVTTSKSSTVESSFVSDTYTPPGSTLKAESIPLMATAPMGLSEPGTALIGAGVITTQPEGMAMPTPMAEPVVTTQPGPNTAPVGPTAAEPNYTSIDDTELCCSICLDTCCSRGGGDGGQCCAGGDSGGCCEGDSGGCDDCGDCDC